MQGHQQRSAATRVVRIKNAYSTGEMSSWTSECGLLSATGSKVYVSLDGMSTTVRGLRGLARVAAISVTAASVAITHAAGYVGAEDCGGCHPSEFTRQSGSAHAHALSRTPDHAVAVSFPLGTKLTRKPFYSFEFFRAGGGLETRIFD